MTLVFIREAYYLRDIARIEAFKTEEEADKFISENRQDGRKLWKKVSV